MDAAAPQAASHIARLLATAPCLVGGGGGGGGGSGGGGASEASGACNPFDVAFDAPAEGAAEG